MYARAARRTSALRVPTLTLDGAVPESAPAPASWPRSGLSCAEPDLPFLPRRACPPILSESKRLVSAPFPEDAFPPAGPLFSIFASRPFAAATRPSSSPRPTPSSGMSRSPCVGSPDLGASRATYLRVASSRTASKDSTSSGVGPRSAVPSRTCTPGGAVMPKEQALVCANPIMGIYRGNKFSQLFCTVYFIPAAKQATNFNSNLGLSGRTRGV